ncbi:phosphopantetheine-binding protein, partial [Roseibium sp. RKSG952]|uniref:phosphopantetheine-binding protein n=1 Tax=Roseibium sp. RKSG952 TaxID=2529384 RepID=UPI0013C8A94C
RGMRVELGEIEAALVAQDGIARASVVARKTGAGETRLVAYLVPDAVTDQMIADALGIAPADMAPSDLQEMHVLDLEPVLQPGHLRACLEVLLPAHMVPSVFVGLSRLPMTPSGKIDRKALPDVAGSVAQRPYEAPATESEQLVAGAMADLLDLEQVGRQDSFFELGGHSLSTVRLVARLEAATGKAVAVRDVFEAGSVAALAARIDAQDQAADDGVPLVRVDRCGV